MKYDIRQNAPDRLGAVPMRDIDDPLRDSRADFDLSQTESVLTEPPVSRCTWHSRVPAAQL
jgi:hypothetical protein